jgi:hypothetical protein
MQTIHQTSRRELLGKSTEWRISDLGVAKVRHDYPHDLLQAIAKRATEVKERESHKRHLNLRYIRNAQSVIPEINELLHWPGRLNALSELAGTQLEDYPFSVAKTTITFMGPEDGTVQWHCDGVPATELVALEVHDTEGGELTVYAGDPDEGLEAMRRGETLPEDRLIRLQHEVGCSMVAQLIRVLHRAEPMTRGSRITLNFGLRSMERPYIDDNSMFYLAADNPSFDFVDEYVADVRERQLPAYVASRAA